VKRRRRLVLIVGGTLAALVLVLNVLSAFIATRPALQSRLFGQNKRDPQSPEDLGLPFERVTYGKGLWGWWIPAERQKGVVVMVHGFGLSDAPIRFGPAPLVPLAGALRPHGFSSLIINLGYATGAHHYTGGRKEAADIDQAVKWLLDRKCAPVAVWGFSAGGHDALIAAAANDGITGVAADSAFVDTGEIVKQQAALTVHLPRAFLSLTPRLFSAFGGRDVDVGHAWERARRKPVLLIHGVADTSISPSNSRRLAKITDGELWIVDGAAHTEAYNVEPDEYVARALMFLGTVTSLRRSPHGCD
jgi:pimeloyl-ACP methyl ester carboxylesterase